MKTSVLRLSFRSVPTLQRPGIRWGSLQPKAAQTLDAFCDLLSWHQTGHRPEPIGVDLAAWAQIGAVALEDDLERDEDKWRSEDRVPRRFDLPLNLSTGDFLAAV